MARIFAQVDYGNVALIIDQLRAENKRVVLKAVEALHALLRSDDCADICVRYGAVPALSACSRGRALDIKLVSLRIVNKLLKCEAVKVFVQKQLLDTKTVQASLKLVEQFPSEDADHDILAEVAEMLSLVVTQNESATNYMVQQ